MVSMLASAPRTASASLFGSLSSVPDIRTPVSVRSCRSLPLSSHAQPIRHLPSLPAQHQRQNKQLLRCATTTEVQPVANEDAVEGMSEFLDSLKWDDAGLVAAVVQHVDTGELLMQAFADRAAVSETLQTGLATFYSRSRSGRWRKGETSGHFIKVGSVFPDCDRDSLVYLGEPIGPACHTGAPSCWFSEAALREGRMTEDGEHSTRQSAPLSTLLALERTIAERRTEMEAETGSKSWTAKLLGDPALCCSKIREEAGELAQTWEASEGGERAASEAADLLYHSLVLLNTQGVSVEEVLRVLRSRFGTSGIAEKESRKAKH